MSLEEFKQPSGKDYGRVIRWGWVDDKEFILSLSVNDAENTYKWVVEAKNGDLIQLDTHHPFHEPVFGVDEGDWMNWVQTTYTKIDAYIAANASK